MWQSNGMSLYNMGKIKKSSNIKLIWFLQASNKILSSFDKLQRKVLG